MSAVAAGIGLFDRVVCALNGVLGDRLAREGNALAVPMELRARGEALAIEPAALAAAYPQATDRIALFVHGLSCDEAMWGRAPVGRWSQEGTSYGHLLSTRHGYSDLYLRYNSGLRLDENGRSLAQLLTGLLAAWPVPVSRLVLIGHSMGGLVVRSACHHGQREGAAWVARVSDVVCLGSPHLGAPLEKLGAVAVAALGLLDVTAPFGRAIDLRSAGIQDLRHGRLLDGTPVPRPDSLAHARHLFVGSSLEPHGLGWALGDGMVRVDSATAREVEHVETAVLRGVNHLALMNHPDVWARLEPLLGAP